MQEYNIPNDFEDLVRNLKNDNFFFSIEDIDKPGDNSYSISLFIDMLEIPEECIIVNDGTKIEVKSEDLLFTIQASGGGDMHIHNYEINIEESYEPILEFNIIEEKEEHEIYSMVQRIHPDYDDAFVDGDLGKRIEEFEYYHLYNENLDILDEDEWSVCEGKVEDYIEKIKTEGLKNMPPLVISEDGSVIDGIHRLNALKKLGVKQFKCYVGSNKNIAQLKVEEFLKEKEMPKHDLVYKKIKDAKNKNFKILFHSGDASIENDLKEGIVPEFGSWLEEVLSGATDSEELAEEIRNQEPVAFYDENPKWVAMKASRAIKKDYHKMTEDDIEQAGQLSIVFYDPDDEIMMNAGVRGGEFVEKSTYYGTNETADYELPFGVETGDVYTREVITPDYTLIGKDLTKFLNKYYPELSLKNKLKNSNLKPKH